MIFLISFLADWLIYFLFLVLPYFWIKGESKLVLRLAMSVLLASLVGRLIKHVFFVERPYVALGFDPMANNYTDSSFPSNHTAVSFALSAGVYWSYCKLGLFLGLLAALIGAARVWAGVHYPIDIAGGIVVGILSSWLVFFLEKRFLVLVDRRDN